jgi:hypothetical protein
MIPGNPRKNTGGRNDYNESQIFLYLKKPHAFKLPGIWFHDTGADYAVALFVFQEKRPVSRSGRR